MTGGANDARVIGPEDADEEEPQSQHDHDGERELAQTFDDEGILLRFLLVRLVLLGGAAAPTFVSRFDFWPGSDGQRKRGRDADLAREPVRLSVLLLISLS